MTAYAVTELACDSCGFLLREIGARWDVRAIATRRGWYTAWSPRGLLDYCDQCPPVVANGTTSD